MIVFNERFEFERDRNAWQLHEWVEGFNKKENKPTKNKHTTYHPSIELVLKSIVDKSCSESTSFKEIKTLLLSLNDTIDKVGKRYQSFLDLVGEEK